VVQSASGNGYGRIVVNAATLADAHIGTGPAIAANGLIATDGASFDGQGRSLDG
jgi:hypothetical protein